MGNLEVEIVAHKEKYILNGFQKDLVSKRETINKLARLIIEHPDLYGFSIPTEMGVELSKKDGRQRAMRVLEEHIRENAPKKYKQINAPFEAYKELKILSVELDKTLSNTLVFLIEHYNKTKSSIPEWAE